MVLGTQGKKPKKKTAHRQPIHAGYLLTAVTALTQGLEPSFGFRGSSSSESIGHSFTSTNSFGRRTMHQEVLHATAIQVRQRHDQKDYQHDNESITIGERTQLALIRADENFPDQNEDEFSHVDIHNILTGDAAADLSHAGGEFAELLAIEDGLLGPASQ
jgi:hypothetical protein